MSELAESLRAWRERLQPADAGLPAGTSRRTPGLRREELAGLAGVSVDYLARLEQGRLSNPSVSVIEALARALRLDSDERAHLFHAAGQEPPGSGRIDRRVTPGAQRIMDRLSDAPVMVLDAAWTVLAWNALAAALIGDISAWRGRGRNIAWRQLTDAPGRVVRTEEEAMAMDRDAVADLRAALGRYPEDPELLGLIEDLKRDSDRFTTLWEERPVHIRVASRKTIDHPEVGPITVDCDVMTVHGSDLRMIVYTAPPGSPDAEALRLVGVLGLQKFARSTS